MPLAANLTFAQAFRSFVIAEPSISALIGTRFWPGQANQRALVPYGVYRRISTRRISSHSGPSSLAAVRYQIDWTGGTGTSALQGYALAAEVAHVARLVLQDFRGIMITIRVDRIEYDDERDMFDSGTKAIGVSQDIIVWHEEASNLWPLN